MLRLTMLRLTRIFLLTMVPVALAISPGAALGATHGTSRSLIGTATGGSVITASRGTAAHAREALIRAQLNPRPLYPAELPNPLSDGNSAAFTHGHFFVWKGRNTSPAWFSIEYRCLCYAKDYVSLSFSRGPVSDIAKAIDLSRNVQVHPVQRVRVDRKLMYRFQTNSWFGYMWKQQGFAYSVLERYSPLVGWGFVRQFVDSLYPLGHLWKGSTSQGEPVSLYRSGGGLDWFVFWNANCADGSRLDTGWDEGLVGVNRDGAFDDLDSYGYIADDGTHIQETFSMRGKFPASADASVTGLFNAHDANAYDQRDRHWQCDANVTWQANPI